MRSLARRQGRARYGQFLAEGPQSVREAVAHRPDLVRDLYLTDAARHRHPGLAADAERAGLFVHEVTEPVLAAMADTQTPQGMLAVCDIPTAGLGPVLADRPRLLCVLAAVRDPGNAGTVLRAADAAGADAVLVSADSVDVWSPKVVRAAAGSVFHLPVVTGATPQELVGRLRAAGIRTLAASGSGRTALTDPGLDLGTPHAWVLGNEAWGLPQDVQDACDGVVRVPIHGHAESLNLAMAATVCLYASAGVLRPAAPPLPVTGSRYDDLPAPRSREVS